MTIQNAIDAYESATDTDEAREAFGWIVEHIAADEDLPDDADFESGAEKALTDRGIKLKH